MTSRTIYIHEFGPKIDWLLQKMPDGASRNISVRFPRQHMELCDRIRVKSPRLSNWKNENNWRPDLIATINLMRVYGFGPSEDDLSNLELGEALFEWCRNGWTTWYDPDGWTSERVRSDSQQQFSRRYMDALRSGELRFNQPILGEVITKPNSPSTDRPIFFRRLLGLDLSQNETEQPSHRHLFVQLMADAETRVLDGTVAVSEAEVHVDFEACRIVQDAKGEDSRAGATQEGILIAGGKIRIRARGSMKTPVWVFVAEPSQSLDGPLRPGNGPTCKFTLDSKTWIIRGSVFVPLRCLHFSQEVNDKNKGLIIDRIKALYLQDDGNEMILLSSDELMESDNA